MNSIDFFKWCEEQNLLSNVEISKTLNVSAQTIRNWRNKESLPNWVYFACIAIEKDFIPMSFTVSDLKSWQIQNNLQTYEQTGSVFGIKRQAVHQWFRRGRFPKWLGLACEGYNLTK
jgi:DNA-binding XRE family transcriptional regulator